MEHQNYVRNREMVCNIVQSARAGLLRAASDIPPGKHDLLTLVYQDDDCDTRVTVTWSNVTDESVSGAQLKRISCSKMTHGGQSAAPSCVGVYPTFDEQLATEDSCANTLAALAKKPFAYWGVKREQLYLKANVGLGKLEAVASWNVLDSVKFQAAAIYQVPTDVRDYFAPLYTTHCCEPDNRAVMRKLLKRDVREDSEQYLMVQTLGGEPRLFVVIPGISYNTIPEVCELFEDNATYRLITLLDHSSSCIVAVTAHLPEEYGAYPELVGKPAIITYSVERNYEASVKALPPKLHYLVQSKQSVVLDASIEHYPLGTELVSEDIALTDIQKAIDFVRSSDADLAIVERGSGQEHALRFLAPYANTAHLAYVMTVNDTSALTYHEWNRVTAELAKHHLRITVLQPDWSTRKLFQSEA